MTTSKGDNKRECYEFREELGECVLNLDPVSSVGLYKLFYKSSTPRIFPDLEGQNTEYSPNVSVLVWAPQNVFTK